MRTYNFAHDDSFRLSARVGQTLLNDDEKRPPPVVCTSTRSLLAALGVLVVATLVMYVGSAAVGDETLATRVFSVWTNALFVVPLYRALRRCAAAEALVLYVTLVVSTLHHGCLFDDGHREAVADAVYLVLGLSSLVALALVIVYARGPARTCIRIGAGLVAIAVAVVVLGLGLAAAPDTLDGCLYIHSAGDTSYVAALVPVWTTVDLVTALAALTVALVFVLRTSRALELGLVWSFAVVTLVLALYREYALLDAAVLYWTLALGYALFVVVRLAVCLTTETHSATRWADVVGALVVVAAGVLLVAGYNETMGHGLWHALAATGLLLIIDARGKQ